MSDGLPQGWASAKLGELISFALGGDWGKGPDEITEGSVKVHVIRGTEFRSWRDRRGASAAERWIKASSLERRRLARGDIVLEVSGGGPDQPVGRTIFIDEETLRQADAPLVCSNFFRQLRLRSELDPHFVSHFLDYAYAKGMFNEYQTQTTNLRNLNVADFLEKTDVWVAPLAEQRRIVAKLEALLNKVDSARKRLERTPTLLKRFRQSVLVTASSGRLTADWRSATGQDGEWPIRELSNLGNVTGGITKNTKRHAMKLQVPYLRVANVYEHRLELSKVLEIGVTEQEFERARLFKDDVLFVEGNGSLDQIGRVALWDGSIARCVHQNHLIKFRAGNDLLPAYVLLQMMAPEGRSQLIEKATSSAGLNTLSISKISDLRLPVPTIAEQEEIVRRVEALFAVADQIEARYAKAKAQVDKLTQSLLAKAFRGELVPTEAELARRKGRGYEDARSLLNRLSPKGDDGKPRHVTRKPARGRQRHHRTVRTRGL